MKKNVIALAVAAALVAPLAAQAEVKVSGVLQAELQSVTADKTLRTATWTTTTGPSGSTVTNTYSFGVQDGMFLENGNRGKIEFSAKEDLGNGLTAIAKYGMNATATTAKGTGVSQRDAYVGLSGSFGTVLAGTMTNPYKGSTVSWDPFLETGAQARGNNGMSDLHNGYTANALAYANKFGMANVKLAYAVDESVDANNSTNGDATIVASLNMPVGPVEVAVAYLDNAAADEGTATKIGVKYTAGAMGVAFQYETLGAGVQDSLAGLSNAAMAALGGAAKDGQTNMYINGTYTAGANTFAVAYGQETWSMKGGDADLTHMTVGMVHSFSKNTKAYAAYMANDYDLAQASAIAAGLRVGF